MHRVREASMAAMHLWLKVLDLRSLGRLEPRFAWSMGAWWHYFSSLWDAVDTIFDHWGNPGDLQASHGSGMGAPNEILVKLVTPSGLTQAGLCTTRVGQMWLKYDKQWDSRKINEK